MTSTSGISSRNILSFGKSEEGAFCHIATHLLFFSCVFFFHRMREAKKKNWLNARSWHFVRQIVARRHRNIYL